MKNKLLSAALAAVITLSCCTASVASFSAAQTDDTAGSSQYAQDSISGAAVLHCFNWSYNEIKKNLPQIAEAGYTAVQTSPVQQPKDYKSSYTEMSGQWWKLYQPLTLSIADGGTSWLGTKAELKAMCEEADNYNIKVIVDIVSNHMANKQEGGGYKNLSPDVESDMKNADYYHTETYAASDSARYSMTHGHIGMPDLNTANSHVQQRVLGLLEECVDCGVDGFRFDAAKHIELPSDNDKTKSDFWSVIINGIKKKKSDIFCYGEILNSAATDIKNYTEYIAITDNRTGNYALSVAKSKNAKSLSKNTYMMGAAAADSVLWAESHDTYMNEGTDAIDNSIIYKAWAITGARAESTSLYLARPNSKMGLASTDDGWKSKTVSEINKFKNYLWRTAPTRIRSRAIPSPSRTGSSAVRSARPALLSYTIPSPKSPPSPLRSATPTSTEKSRSTTLRWFRSTSPSSRSPSISKLPEIPTATALWTSTTRAQFRCIWLKCRLRALSAKP